MCCAALLQGCDLPRDAEGTLPRLRGGELRVGVAEHPPWTTIVDGRVDGVEPRLVAELARELGARTAWRRGSESELLESLHARRLDLVIGGLTDDSPWRGKVAFTTPYFTDTVADRRHVFALSPGENAWQMRVERFLDSRQGVGAMGDAGSAR
jgi:ABC-type amino acid transport substrate-binding protein